MITKPKKINFADKMAEACQQKNSVVCIGLDPRLEMLPAKIKPVPNATQEEQAKACLEFCQGIINAIAGSIPAVKPNIAFFEALGVPGIQAYAQVCNFALAKELLVIGDVKRGDIGSTAKAYATGLLTAEKGENSLANHSALTLNPYLGSDSVAPFIEVASKNGQGMFLLVKTSNPSSSDIQEQLLENGKTVADLVGNLVSRWGKHEIGACGFSAVGAVIGATHREDLAHFRKLMPHTPFLLPGYGSQGANASDIVGAFRSDCLGGLVNASRSVIFAWQKDKTEDYTGAALKAVKEMNKKINKELKAAGKKFNHKN